MICERCTPPITLSFGMRESRDPMILYPKSRSPSSVSSQNLNGCTNRQTDGNISIFSIAETAVHLAQKSSIKTKKSIHLGFNMGPVLSFMSQQPMPCHYFPPTRDTLTVCRWKFPPISKLGLQWRIFPNGDRENGTNTVFFLRKLKHPRKNS